MKSNAERVREWRAKHPDEAKRQRRESMAWQRAKAKLGPPANFARWEPESQRRWLKANRPDLLKGELADDNIREWLAGE